MSSQLKKFVTAHRQAFDTDEPGSGVWEKIEARMTVQRPARISSRWLSKLKYLGFSASVLVVAVYFIMEGADRTSASVPVQDKKMPVGARPDLLNKRPTSTPAIIKASPVKKAPVLSNKGPQPGSAVFPRETPTRLHPAAVSQTDSAFTKKGIEKTFSDADQRSSKTSAAAPLREAAPANADKKPELYLPEAPEEINNYTGIIYDASCLCAVLRAYKFPGKLKVSPGKYKGDNKKYKAILQTVSCGNLENEGGMKAVWVKGRTDKKLTLSIKKGFKNIVLLKPDGRKFNPAAISHYYPGRGVITGYMGKYLDLSFEDQVEVILFFREAEEGDHVVIDGVLETVVKNRPGNLE